jgi:threonine dehydratase
MPRGWPITYEDVVAARERIRPHVPATPLRRYVELDRAVGAGVRVLVKHENHQPTNSFKVRNALSALTALSQEQRSRGVIAASRGNHGQGLAWAGQLLGIPVVICVPEGNNPEKNAAIRGFGAELVIEGRDYDASIEVARRLIAERGLCEIHATNNADIISGAGTITLEILEQVGDTRLDALVFSVGGGSQAVGAMPVVEALRPRLPIYAVQAAGAAAQHDSWHAGERLESKSADTIADGLATRTTYDSTFKALRDGLTDFVTVSEAEIAEAVRICLRTTNNLVEGAGAVGLAGLIKLRGRLERQTAAIVFSGGNIDEDTLRRILNHEV